MGKLRDLTGQRFGRVVVISRADDYRPPGNPFSPQPRWNCICDCGTEFITYGEHLKSGRTKSCGCLRKDVASIMGKNRKGKHWHQKVSGRGGTYV